MTSAVPAAPRPPVIAAVSSHHRPVDAGTTAWDGSAVSAWPAERVNVQHEERQRKVGTVTVTPAKTANPTTRHVTVCHRQLRVDVRTGDGSGTPLLMCDGIGTSVEVLQSLVDALDPGIDIIRFDAPGVGGSPVGRRPAPRVPAAGLDADPDAGRAGPPTG